ncbi:hypothetical protein DFA_07166 [Cavenderia fasciculata]|uniref:SprT-like domain-containing protein n=1 Tax=Cavenderia fasciculata TaxID=261658 RepID=F4PVN5_CACFS|nr:uncharacterized protein DFA_07166 [Cavenderia fasciculata]EGG20049.1 hypothetical protein DFA_07166 [Cavenderia fasciculata]|eukprot:XP_004367032.1 hypothetical protein DFA_07166 [Cavenderia fasciculata]
MSRRALSQRNELSAKVKDTLSKTPTKGSAPSSSTSSSNDNQTRTKKKIIVESSDDDDDQDENDEPVKPVKKSTSTTTKNTSSSTNKPSSASSSSSTTNKSSSSSSTTNKPLSSSSTLKPISSSSSITKTKPSSVESTSVSSKPVPTLSSTTSTKSKPTDQVQVERTKTKANESTTISKEEEEFKRMVMKRYQDEAKKKGWSFNPDKSYKHIDTKSMSKMILSLILLEDQQQQQQEEEEQQLLEKVHNVNLGNDSQKQSIKPTTTPKGGLSSQLKQLRRLSSSSSNIMTMLENVPLYDTNHEKVKVKEEKTTTIPTSTLPPPPSKNNNSVDDLMQNIKRLSIQPNNNKSINSTTPSSSSQQQIKIEFDDSPHLPAKPKHVYIDEMNGSMGKDDTNPNDILNVPPLNNFINATIRQYENFIMFKKEYAAIYFERMNTTIFQNRFPSHQQMIEFEQHSGLDNPQQSVAPAKVSIKENESKQRTAIIILNLNEIKTIQKMVNVLCHQMCHAATWIFNDSTVPHGTQFKYWVRLALAIYPDLSIDLCDNYNSNSKFHYKCQNKQCTVTFGRPSKLTETILCGQCNSPIVPMSSSDSTGTGTGNNHLVDKCDDAEFKAFYYEHLEEIEKKYGKQIPNEQKLSIARLKFKQLAKIQKVKLIK